MNFSRVYPQGIKAPPTNQALLGFVQWWAVPTLRGLTFAPSMQPSIAAFIGSSKNLFERSEFIFAPMKARSAGKSRSDLIVGCPFFWFRFLWASKENDETAGSRFARPKGRPEGEAHGCAE